MSGDANRSSTEDRSTALRLRAERMLAGRRGQESPVPAADVTALVHDLSVHQIELEIQNEELREAQQSLARSRDDFARLYHQAPVGYATLDPNAMVLQANETLAAMVRREVSSLVGSAFADCFADGDRAVFHARYRAFFNDPSGKSMELRLRRSDGEALVARLTATRALEVVGGTADRAARPLLVVVHDVTEAHRASAALQKEKELLAVTLRGIGDGVIATDVMGRVSLMNRAAEELTGWTLDESAGRALTDVLALVDESSRRPSPSAVVQVLASAGAAAVTCRALLLARGGTERVVATVAAPMRGEEGVILGVVLAFRDISEETRLNREIERMAKLDSLGVMAGGIAHDFNNLLTSIAGNMGLAQIHLQDDELADAVALVTDAERAAIRARGLTRQLLTFAKGGAPVREVVALPPIVAEAAALALSGARSRCQVDAPDGTWAVHADPGQVAQVLHNLLLNADQAMPGGGVVELALRNVDVQPGASELVGPGPYVSIVVTDHGVGILPENRERIFDPFFTTKQRGSGLGLASAYSIVRKHGGRIRVDSVPGEGSVFTIFLPALPQASPRPAAHVEPAIPAKPWRILVMDDEPMIAGVADQVLKKGGHEVTVVDEGEAAIKAWTAARESGRPFDLVILDLTIPGGMGGKEVAARLRLMQPDFRAVATSGYSTDPVMANHSDFGFVARLPKPYSVRDLRAIVAELQSADRGGA